MGHGEPLANVAHYAAPGYLDSLGDLGTQGSFAQHKKTCTSQCLLPSNGHVPKLLHVFGDPLRPEMGDPEGGPIRVYESRYVPGDRLHQFRLRALARSCPPGTYHLPGP